MISIDTRQAVDGVDSVRPTHPRPESSKKGSTLTTTVLAELKKREATMQAGTAKREDAERQCRCDTALDVCGRYAHRHTDAQAQENLTKQCS